MKKAINLIFVLLFLMPGIQAAIVSGTVYDLALEPVQNAIVEVNSVPEQTVVAKEGRYSLDLSTGDYLINAKAEINFEKFSIEREIKIVDDGNYNLDLILFPDLSDEEDLINQDLNFNEDIFQEEKSYPLEIILLVAIFVLIMVIVFKYKFAKNKVKKEESYDDSDLAKNILEFIKNKEGRVTQREIRKNFPASEAKISLILTELEDNNSIKKIKKGRGNVIILNKGEN